MPIVPSELAAAPDARLMAKLAEHAVAAAPAWLWSADGTRLLWANAVGAAIFGAANAGDCAARRFEATHQAAQAVARLATTLPATGRSRLERLRGFGANFGRALICACSRVTLADGSVALFIAATEPAGPTLPLRDRVAPVLSGDAEPAAAFTPDGALLFANAAAAERFAGQVSLSAFGLEAIAAQAEESGTAHGASAHGPATVDRLGSGSSLVLVARFAASPNETDAGGAEAEAAAAAAAEATPAERRHPLRFVWQMDTEGRFVAGSHEFVDLLGPRTPVAFGRPWRDIAADLQLDPEDAVARAVATRETWSGITVSWPVGDAGARVAVELSGLPVFDRDRAFRGYRGFGVCRDVARLDELTRARPERPAAFAAQAAAPSGGDASETDGLAPPPAAGARVERPASRIAPAAANVVPFRASAAPEAKGPALSPVERTAFRELAQELTARLRGTPDGAAGDGEAIAAEAELANGALATLAGATAVALAGAEPAASPGEPIGVQGGDAAAVPEMQDASALELKVLDCLPLGVLIYRAPAALAELVYANRYALELSGYPNLETLAAAGLDRLFGAPGVGALAADGVVQSLSVTTRAGECRALEARLFALSWRGAPAHALTISDSEASDRRRASALAKAENEMNELKATLESVRQSEADLRAAARDAQKAAVARADFVAKVSHEIRTPLNAIAGFAEVIIAERFGPIGNERYREYLQDIHAAGTHLVALLNDTVDLSKIETGQLDLVFAHVSLNDLTQQCVGIMQPQASRARIIIRTSLAPEPLQVVADERTLRQIVLNLIAHSIRFTGPGGQVIVSTAYADSGEAVLRVRDTGVGMSEKDVAALLEPFRQTATSASWGSGGTGVGLPLTKALVEANRAHFAIRSAPNAGTLVEVAFPPNRVVAGA
jgi:signal transduction histidine kinase